MDTPQARHARQPARAVPGERRRGAASLARRRRLRDRRHQDVRRPAGRRAARADRRQAAVREGDRGRAARRRRSIWPCTAARTCRRCCRTACARRGAAARGCPRRDRAAAPLGRSSRDSGRPESGSVASKTIVHAAWRSAADRHEQRPADRAADAALSRRQIRPDSWQSRHPPAQAGRGRVRRAGAGRRRTAAAGTRRRGSRRQLPADVCVPAPGQGIIAVEVRERRCEGARAS